MPSSFKKENRNWVEYRQLPNLDEIDFHWQNSGDFRGFHESMQDVYETTMNALQRAQIAGKQYVLFTHGHSTSRRGRTSSRSQVRKAMRSKEATPFIIRSKCIQNTSVFVAVIKPITPTKLED